MTLLPPLFHLLSEGPSLPSRASLSAEPQCKHSCTIITNVLLSEAASTLVWTGPPRPLLPLQRPEERPAPSAQWRLRAESKQTVERGEARPQPGIRPGAEPSRPALTAGREHAGYPAASSRSLPSAGRPHPRAGGRSPERPRPSGRSRRGAAAPRAGATSSLRDATRLGRKYAALGLQRLFYSKALVCSLCSAPSRPQDTLGDGRLRRGEGPGRGGGASLGPGRRAASPGPCCPLLAAAIVTSAPSNRSHTLLGPKRRWEPEPAASTWDCPSVWDVRGSGQAETRPSLWDPWSPAGDGAGHRATKQRDSPCSRGSPCRGLKPQAPHAPGASRSRLLRQEGASSCPPKAPVAQHLGPPIHGSPRSVTSARSLRMCEAAGHTRP